MRSAEDLMLASRSITLATTHPRDAIHLGTEGIETTQLTGV